MTRPHLTTREDSARDLSQTEAANRMDAESHWDGYDDRPTPDDWAEGGRSIYDDWEALQRMRAEG